MKDFKNRSWGEFVIKDIFNIYTGAYIPQKELVCGMTPRITASEQDNGIIGCYAKQGHKNYRELTNFISISFLGGVFYHPYTASLDMKIHAVTIPNIQLNRYIGLFLVSALRRSVCYATYGNQLSSSDLPKKKILLPVNSLGNPDYHYMEDYMKKKEEQILKPTIEKLHKQLLNSDVVNSLRGGDLAHSNWKEFVFGNEFSIQATNSGIDKNKLNQREGKTPYVTRSDLNNGMDMFIAEQPFYKIDEGNVITIGLDTQTVFYQPMSFYTGQNIQIIKHAELDRYNAMFLTVAIKKLVEKFSWGSCGATLSRLRKSRIYLPATDKGEIDFAFMSAFMKDVEFRMLNTTLNVFRDRVGDIN